MVIHNQVRSRNRTLSARILILLLVSLILICGCLDVEPEELPLQTTPLLPSVTVSPAFTPDITETPSSVPRPVSITSPRQVRIYTELGLPAESEEAVRDFTGGITTDTINGFLRWESVRARMNQSETTGIQNQIHRIDTALFNATVYENITVYTGVGGEQSQRILNDSVFSENGYLIASYDPSVIYEHLHNSGRDNEGYLTMCVIGFHKGDRLLLVNASDREFLVPRGGIWDVAGEETYGQLEYSPDSVLRYDDNIQTNVRLIYTKEHP